MVADEARQTHTFDAVIEEAGRGGACVSIPFDVHAVFGTRGQVRIQATFDGVPYRGSLAPMGGRHVLGVRKAIRESLGKRPGDPIRVEVWADTDPREVDVPADLAEALASRPRARAFFHGLAYTYRKEYVGWITGAKRPETPTRRLEKTLDKLERGEKP